MLLRMATLENKKFNNKLLKTQHYILAGAPGFEPGNGGIKIRCLGPTGPATLRHNP